MIHRYEVLELGDYSRRIGENNVGFVLATFDCPLNHEVQDQMIRVLESVAWISNQEL